MSADDDAVNQVINIALMVCIPILACMIQPEYQANSITDFDRYQNSRENLYIYLNKKETYYSLS